MALSIKNDKVITIVPPKKLSSTERDKLVNTPINDKLIKKATSRKYNIVQYQLSKKIIASLELSDLFEQKHRETLFIEDICKRVKKSKTVLYVLKKDNENLGLISISSTSIEDFPALQIDFLFVSKKYRGLVLEDLDNVKTSEYLIELVISIAKNIQENIGLKYIVLLPDNKDLEKIYKELNFNKLNKTGWMFISI